MLRSEQEADRSILAELLGSHPEAISAADELIARFGSLPRLFSAPASSVRTQAGADAARVIDAARRACLAIVREEIAPGVRIADSAQCVRYVRACLANRRQEVLLALHLDGDQCLILAEEVAVGTLNQVAFHPREILGRAIELGAASIILAHNHPSGRHAPSKADVAASKALVSPAAALGIAIQDHLVVARRGWTSLKAAGLL